MEDPLTKIDFITSDLSKRLHDLKSGKPVGVLKENEYQGVFETIEELIHQFESTLIIRHLGFSMKELRSVELERVRLKPYFESTECLAPDETQTKSIQEELDYYTSQIQVILEWATTKNKYLNQDKVIVENIFYLSTIEVSKRFQEAQKKLGISRNEATVLLYLMRKYDLILNYSSNSDLAQLVHLSTGYSSVKVRVESLGNIAHILSEKESLKTLTEKLRSIIDELT
jgi:hypothetical protein